MSTIFDLANWYLWFETQILHGKHDPLIYGKILVSLISESLGVHPLLIFKEVSFCEPFFEIREQYH